MFECAKAHNDRRITYEFRRSLQLRHNICYRRPSEVIVLRRREYHVLLWISVCRAWEEGRRLEQGSIVTCYTLRWRQIDAGCLAPPSANLTSLAAWGPWAPIAFISRITSVSNYWPRVNHQGLTEVEHPDVSRNLILVDNQIYITNLIRLGALLHTIWMESWEPSWGFKLILRGSPGRRNNRGWG